MIWTPNSGKTSLFFGKGRAMVRIDGPIVADLTDQIRAALGPVAEVLEQEVQEIAQNAREVWPVKTGKQRDSIAAGFRVLPGEFIVEGFVSVDQSARYTVSAKIGEKDLATRLRAPLTTEIRRPMKERKKVLTKELPMIFSQWLDAQMGSASGTGAGPSGMFGGELGAAALGSKAA